MTNSSVFRQKGESQNGGNRKTKHDKFLEKKKKKKKICCPQIRTRTFAYQRVRNIRFSGTFGMCFLVTSV